MMGRDFLAASARERDRRLDGALVYWRARGFPFPDLTAAEVELEFRRLQNVPSSLTLHGHLLRPSTVGLRLANAFHRQMWKVPSHRHIKGPIDYFQDDRTLRKLLERAPRFWPNRACWNAQCLRSLLRMYGGGRVANFRPTAAKAIIERFSRRDGVILDFSAGFGGRLLGSLALHRHYVGLEPARLQVQGLRKMIRALKPVAAGSANILHGCAEDLMKSLSPHSIDLIFSSPPYFNIERYSEEPNQSFRRYQTYADWKTGFLERVIESSTRVLKPGGTLVLNVANTARFPIADDICAIAARSLRRRSGLKLMMHTRPVQRSSGSMGFRWEPVLVFRKLS
jgi:hypothetical protein